MGSRATDLIGEHNVEWDTGELSQGKDFNLIKCPNWGETHSNGDDGPVCCPAP